RVLTTLGHQEPDRVPLFLLLTMHGAKELGTTIPDYFSKAENVAEGQMKLREKYGDDCLYNIFYAPIEVEAAGGDVIFRDDGPANSGKPLIQSIEDIKSYQHPDPKTSPLLSEVLKATSLMKNEIGDEAPIIGVVMSPFSLPVMQMGFDKYLELMVYNEDEFNILMDKNIEFCVAWANAQLEAGATAIGYFDPVSASSIITREQYLNTGFKIAKKTISQINGPTATHFASARCLPILDDVSQTGTLIAGISSLEDSKDLKEVSKGKITLLGNLNGIEMVRWTPEMAEQKVKEVISKAGAGGGFILSDNHGEIPFQVPDEVLFAISKAVRKWGKYPLKNN
ncbi:uroporphyrinogen decarboxylase family protein, partial [Bacteroidota bacterium]